MVEMADNRRFWIAPRALRADSWRASDRDRPFTDLGPHRPSDIQASALLRKRPFNEFMGCFMSDCCRPQEAL